MNVDVGGQNQVWSAGSLESVSQGHNQYNLCRSQCHQNSVTVTELTWGTWYISPSPLLWHCQMVILVMSCYCVHTQLFPLLEMTDALIISPNSFFVTLSGGTYLFRSICLFVNVPLCLMATLTLSISHNSTAHGITVKFTSFGLCLSLENKFCFY